MATCRFSRADGKGFARPLGSTLAANGRPSAGDARDDPSLLSANALVQWQRQIQIGGNLLVIGLGIFRFINRRHPRGADAYTPTQLGLWTFAVAIAHGAGLMLVPIYLGLCRAADLNKGHEAAGASSMPTSACRPGLRRPLGDDHRSRRHLGLAGLPASGSQVPIPELVQSACDLDLQPHIGGRSLAYDQLGEPSRAASRCRVQGSVTQYKDAFRFARSCA
jgi:hypothetical protein